VSPLTQGLRYRAACDDNSVCPSGCPSHAGIVAKRLNTSSKFFTAEELRHSRFLRINTYYEIQTGPHINILISRFSADKSLYLGDGAR